MSEWQPIETAPKDGRAIILYLPWLKTARTGRWAIKGPRRGWLVHWSTTNKSVVASEPTLWMSLPELPE